ncbi:MAG: hypothetical protein BroJett011_08050 [Chloroflexota bacterium]|nr:MAG: hypothetical protein BroJett011_08050 [Chloroflexota bacterium]
MAITIACLIFLKRTDSNAAVQQPLVPTPTPPAVSVLPELPIEISQVRLSPPVAQPAATTLIPTSTPEVVWVFPQQVSVTLTPPPILLPSPLLGLPVRGEITQGFGCSLYYTGIAGPGCPDSQPWFHDGLDIAIPLDTPVRSVIPGTVIFAGPDTSGPECDSDGYRGYGLAVVVDSGDGWQALYAHLSRVEVTPGQSVSPNMAIGASGDSGCATGPHIHFAMKHLGDLVDPRLYLPVGQ